MSSLAGAAEKSFVGKLAKWALILIIIGVVVVVLCIIGVPLLICCGCKRGNSSRHDGKILYDI